MNPKLLEILVCPVTKGPLVYDKANKNWCQNPRDWRIRFVMASLSC